MNGSLVYGVIGDPVKHSLSPLMHNAAFKEHNLPYTYGAYHIQKDRLKEGIEASKVLGIRGFNVTVPHKENVMQYLDETDDTAKTIGAVNTVTNKDGKLVGSNTDWLGALQSIESSYDFIKNKKILVLGAGGASHAIVYALVKAKAEVIIVNRTYEKAMRLAEHFSCNAEKIENIRQIKAQLFINASSIGLKAQSETTVVSLLEQYLSSFKGYIAQYEAVMDIVYDPAGTELLQAAADAKVEIITGLSMLINQARESFKIWTGILPDYDTMYKAVRNKL